MAREPASTLATTEFSKLTSTPSVLLAFSSTLARSLFTIADASRHGGYRSTTGLPGSTNPLSTLPYNDPNHALPFCNLGVGNCEQLFCWCDSSSSCPGKIIIGSSEVHRDSTTRVATISRVGWDSVHATVRRISSVLHSGLSLSDPSYHGQKLGTKTTFASGCCRTRSR